MIINSPLTEAQALAVYTILKEECEAPEGCMEDSFLYEFTKTDDKYGVCNEWRFQGNLGYGGKFRYPRMSVDCYLEDETTHRLSAIEKANARLSELKNTFKVA